MSALPVLSAAEMRAAEDAAIGRGATLLGLMEQAGRAVAEAVWRIGAGAETLILCGPGNNGGDGYVAARLLRERGLSVRIAAERQPSTEAACQAAGLWQDGVELPGEARPAPVVVDAVFGTGLSRPLAEAIAHPLRRLCEAARYRIAVDLPSGIASDDGRLLGEVPHFDLTIALGAMKPAHLLLPAAERCGRVSVADIGLGIGAVEARLHRIGRPALAPPPHDANKYSRGKLVIVGGAMPGASRLAARAGQRAGAGYVEWLHPGQAADPASLVQRDWSMPAIADPRIGAIVIGPGLGLDRTARERLEAVLGCGRTVLLDADALTLIGRFRHDRLAGHLLTPHWGEFVRLFGDDGRDRLAQARDAACTAGATILLKGGDSIVAGPDGRAAIAPLAPSWLASAGTGDVLAGIAGALLASGHDPFGAAQAAVWLHTEAAWLAGPMLIADDLIMQLPAAAAACL